MRVGDLYLKDGALRIVGVITEWNDDSDFFYGVEMWVSAFGGVVTNIELRRCYAKDDRTLRWMEWASVSAMPTAAELLAKLDGKIAECEGYVDAVGLPSAEDLDRVAADPAFRAPLRITEVGE